MSQLTNIGPRNLLEPTPAVKAIQAAQRDEPSRGAMAVHPVKAIPEKHAPQTGALEPGFDAQGGEVP